MNMATFRPLNPSDNNPEKRLSNSIATTTEAIEKQDALTVVFIMSINRSVLGRLF